MSQGRHVLDDYRLEKVVRSTPHTTVFRALDPATSRRVVIKLVYPPAATVPETSRTAFLEAAEVARGGEVRGLPRVVDYGFTPDDQAFLVMDMVGLAVPVSGLRDAPARRRVGIAQRVVDAVDALAAAGGAHLNLRTDNLLVALDESVLLTGWGTAAYRVGVAPAVWPDAGDRWTAPELARPEAARCADLGRADLYSLALVVCDLLGGDVKQRGDEQPAVRLPEDTVQDRPGLECALAAALQRDPALREVSLAELRRLLVPPERGVGDAAPGVAELDPNSFETRAITAPLLLEPLPVIPDRPTPEVPEGPAEPPPTSDLDQRAPLPAGEPLPARTEAPVAPAPAVASTGPRERRRLRWWWIVPAAAALLLVTVGGWLLVGRALRGGLVSRAATPRPVTAPRPAPTAAGVATAPALDPILLEAERMMAEGDMAAARSLLDSLPEEAVAGFTGPETELYEELVASIGEADRDKALQDLDGGLENGSVTMLRRAVAALSGLSADELAADPELAGKLDHARRAVAASQRLRDAERGGDPLAVIDRAGEMIAQLPGYSRSYELRDAAAAAVEERAESAVAERNLESALATLRELERRWPTRLGLAARIEWCERELRLEAEMESVLLRAAAAGERGTPEEGLRLLAATAPSEAFASKFEAARERLKEQLAALDAGSPTIALAAGFEPVFRKNETTVVPIEVRDDYRVERVTAWVGGDPASDFREIALAAEDGGLYSLQVTPQLHGNDAVLFYVVAVDRSGHTSQLGSAEQPLRLERKGWLKRLLGSGG